MEVTHWDCHICGWTANDITICNGCGHPYDPVYDAPETDDNISWFDDEDEESEDDEDDEDEDDDE